MEELQAPFPYFGGKSKIANIVWSRFGNVQNYVEPFFGSGAMLLKRPPPFDGIETVNDIDGLVCNFWRAVQADPEQVAYHADWPVNENDLHARHAWLVGQKDSLQSRLEGDPKYFDAQIAGWWVWGMACWIGGEFCSGEGPWQVVEQDGVRQLAKTESAGQGIKRQLVLLGNTGRGVHRTRVHLDDSGRGVHRKRIHIQDQGVTSNKNIYQWFIALQNRLYRVRVCCGDWSRVCGPTPTVVQGLTAVFLDPPYADTANRDNKIYRCDSQSVAHDVREWAIEQGGNPLMRIALCGYEGEHKMPETWECVAWKACGGYGGGKGNRGEKNKNRERIWFSPHCLRPNVIRSKKDLPGQMFLEI